MFVYQYLGTYLEMVREIFNLGNGDGDGWD